jgi:hypothetical protein
MAGEKLRWVNLDLESKERLEFHKRFQLLRSTQIESTES